MAIRIHFRIKRKINFIPLLIIKCKYAQFEFRELNSVIKIYFLLISCNKRHCIIRIKGNWAIMRISTFNFAPLIFKEEINPKWFLINLSLFFRGSRIIERNIGKILVSPIVFTISETMTILI